MSRVVLVSVALCVAFSAAATIELAHPPAARALNVGGTVCSIGSWLSGILGKACNVVQHGGKIISAGKQLAGGHLGQAIGAITGSSSTVRRAVAVAGLAAIAVSVVGGARFALHETATIVSATTEPDLASAWFGGAYWRMAEIAVLLTVPFLLVAAGQAVIRSDLALLARTAFGFLPLSGLAVGIAIPLTILLLRASDELASIVSGGPASSAATMLDRAAGLSGLEMVTHHSVFLGFLLGLIACAITLALWAELAVRQAAVSVIVLMLPLFFAAIVWPARRIWATRAVELLVSLVLAKFAIVAVLALGGAALSHSVRPGPADVLTGITLVLLAAFSPWAVLRMLPLHELAAAAASGLRPHAALPAVTGAAEGTAELVEARAAGEGDTEEPGPQDPVADAEGADQLLGGDEPAPGEAPGGPIGGGGPMSGGGPAGGGAASVAGVGAWGDAHADAVAATSPDTPRQTGAERVDEVLRRPRPGSDVDPVITEAADFSWREIGLDADDLLSDEPLLPGEDPPAPPEDGEAEIDRPEPPEETR